MAEAACFVLGEALAGNAHAFAYQKPMGLAVNHGLSEMIVTIKIDKQRATEAENADGIQMDTGVLNADGEMPACDE